MPHQLSIDACARCAAADGFALPGAQKHYPPDIEIEPVHTDVELRVDIAQRAARGTVTHTLVGRGQAPRSLTLHAQALDDVAVRDPDGGAVDWSYDGRELRLTWDEPLGAGDQRRVAIDYTVSDPGSGLYFSQPTDAYPDEPWYAATDHETERARYWLPCVDLPSVRPRFDFHLRANSRFTILAGGALVGEDEHDDGTTTAHWRLDFPCPSYLACFAIGDFVRADDSAFGDIPVAYFASRQHDPGDLLRTFGRTPDMLAWLTERLDCPFPFPKYYQFALPGFVGAMENISLVSWNDLYVLDEVLFAEWGHLIDAVNIHEMAHSYFGDAIVVRDFAHAWLKESWATYIEQCWWDETVGTDAAMYDYYANATAYFKEADDRYKRPIVTRTFSSSFDLYDRHLYPGGACRLHTLRCLLGDDAFWAGVRAYVREYEGRVVETDDFRRVMEAHSGRSLVHFFDQWFHSPGYPQLKVTFAHDKAKGEGTFTVEQTQEDKDAGVPLFRFDLDLAWVVDDAQHTQQVAVSERKHTFIVRMPAEPAQVRVDPQAKVLHSLEFDPGAPKLVAQLKTAPDVIGRILAARTLAKTGRPKNIRAIRDAYHDEPYWGVRVEMARALGESGTQEAVAALAVLVGREDDPKVLPALITAAGEYRDPAVRAAVEARLQGDVGYLARRAALIVLGQQRAGAPFDLLADQARSDGYGGLAQSGAFLGLAASRRIEAVDLLIDATAYGATSNRSRPAAVTAMGMLGRVLERLPRDRLLEALTDRLRDPTERVRVAAVAGLRLLGDVRAVVALQAYRADRPVQEQVGVDRAVAALRAGAKPSAKAREKELDDLHAELRKVKEAVGKLEARLQLDDAPADEGGAADDIRAEPRHQKAEGPPADKRGAADDEEGAESQHQDAQGPPADKGGAAEDERGNES